jgi:hypothetical protein
MVPSLLVKWFSMRTRTGYATFAVSKAFLSGSQKNSVKNEYSAATNVKFNDKTKSTESRVFQQKL